MIIVLAIWSSPSMFLPACVHPTKESSLLSVHPPRPRIQQQPSYGINPHEQGKMEFHKDADLFTFLNEIKRWNFKNAAE